MKITVDLSRLGTRLDVLVSEEAKLSRSAAARLIENGDVLVNGKAETKKYAVREGDGITVALPEPEEYSVTPEDIPLDVIYEDSDIIVINKPSGMVVHPAAGNLTGTLVNALLFHCRDSLSGIGGVMRPGIVHRIDKDTSGLLVVAKNDGAHIALSRELEHHGIVREYHALVRGGFKEPCGKISYPIGRHPVDRKKMAVLLSPDAHAKEAVTNYELGEAFGEVSYLKLRLETGRTHQIRVHMSYLGHALLGDTVYASTKTRFEKAHPTLFDGQMLHAARLILTHPKTGERMEFSSPLPENFSRALELLYNEAN